MFCKKNGNISTHLSNFYIQLSYYVCMINLNIQSQNNYNPAFCARNAEIRYADDIMRKVNNYFPRISISRIEDYSQTNQTKLTDSIKNFIENKKLFFKRLRLSRPDFETSPDNYVKHSLDSVLRYNHGNCGESGTLGKIGLMLNGIEGTKVILKGFNGKNLETGFDHSFVIVNLSKNANLRDYKTFGKKAYVVDPWLGFVDYVPNAFKRFKIEYENDLRMKVIDTLGVGVCDFKISDEFKNILFERLSDLKLSKRK